MRIDHSTNGQAAPIRWPRNSVFKTCVGLSARPKIHWPPGQVCLGVEASRAGQLRIGRETRRAMDELFETDDDPPVPEGGLLRMLPIINRRGLHARASAKFVQTVERYHAAVDGDPGRRDGGRALDHGSADARRRHGHPHRRHGRRPGCRRQCLDAHRGAARQPVRRGRVAAGSGLLAGPRAQIRDRAARAGRACGPCRCRARGGTARHARRP